MFTILLSAAGCILLLKTVLFVKEFQDKKIKCWVYFNLQEIMLSSTDSRRRDKQRQNNFSIFLLLTIVLSMVWYFMFFTA